MLQSEFVPFVVDNDVLGYCKSDFAKLLESYKDIFVINNQNKIEFLHNFKNFDERTKAIAKVTLSLKEKGKITGWRDELFPVCDNFSSQPKFLIERAAYASFGTRGYGIHLNGYVKNKNGDISLWVARRSSTKQTWPEMLDHIVAGGQPYGLSLQENVIKECYEEASIPESIANKAIPTGAVSYQTKDEDGNLKRDVLFCYDLELPEDFIPIPQDNEVESFSLRSLDWVLDKLVAGTEDGYKPNCNLVIIDFLIRHGVISPESPGYLQLVASLRSGTCQ